MKLFCTSSVVPKTFVWNLGSISLIVTGLGQGMKRHTVFLDGQSTSVSVEDAFWKALAEIAETRQQTMKTLIEEIDQNRQFGNLSSVIRVFVLEFYKEKVNRPTSEESKVATSAGRAIEGG